MEVIMKTNNHNYENNIRTLLIALLIAQIPYIVYAIEISCRYTVQQYRTGSTSSIIEVIFHDQNCQIDPYITPRCVRQTWSGSFDEFKCLFTTDETMLYCYDYEQIDTNYTTYIYYGIPECSWITNNYNVECECRCIYSESPTIETNVTRHYVFTINGEDINHNPCISTNK